MYMYICCAKGHVTPTTVMIVFGIPQWSSNDICCHDNAVFIGKKILDQMHHQLRDAGVSRLTGMHDPDVDEPPPLTPNAAAVIQKQPTEMFTGGEWALWCGRSSDGLIKWLCGQ